MYTINYHWKRFNGIKKFKLGYLDNKKSGYTIHIAVGVQAFQINDVRYETLDHVRHTQKLFANAMINLIEANRYTSLKTNNIFIKGE